MDLASIFILLLNWVVRILISVPLGPEIVNSRQSCSLNFLIRHVVSWHGPLRCKTAASFRKLLNIRNIFRVAFLSCSHIRLEMCSGSLQGRSPFCLCRSVLFCATTFDMLSPNRGFVNNIFHFLFGSFSEARSSVQPFCAGSGRKSSVVQPLFFSSEMYTTTSKMPLQALF